MNDTLKNVEDIYFKKFSLLTGEERIKMSVESFETARVIAIASAGSYLDEMNRKIFLLKRFYGDEKLYGEWEKKVKNENK